MRTPFLSPTRPVHFLLPPGGRGWPPGGVSMALHTALRHPTTRTHPHSSRKAPRLLLSLQRNNRGGASYDGGEGCFGRGGCRCPLPTCIFPSPLGACVASTSKQKLKRRPRKEPAWSRRQGGHPAPRVPASAHGPRPPELCARRLAHLPGARSPSRAAWASGPGRSHRRAAPFGTRGALLWPRPIGRPGGGRSWPSRSLAGASPGGPLGREDCEGPPPAISAG